MNNDLYKQLKKRITLTADNLDFSDKPKRRMILNDLLDDIIRQIDFEVMREWISEKRGELYKTWLTNYTIQRHTH